MKKIRLLIALVFALTLGLLASPTVLAVNDAGGGGGGGGSGGGNTTRGAPCPADQGVLLYPTWFQGLNCENINGTTSVVVSSGTHVWVIVLNIVQWLIITTGYAAVIYVIIGGFKYITASGAPDKVKDAKQTITNAIIGLVISLSAVAIVKTIQASITGGFA